jgi:ureidoacrylate peracid hydrolase
MHKFSMPGEIISRVVARVGRTHPFDKLEASKTAFVVIDMQNYYLKSGYLGDVPLARGIVPAIPTGSRLIYATGAPMWFGSKTRPTVRVRTGLCTMNG